AEGAGLLPFAEDGEGLVLEGLADEGDDDAAVVRVHAGAVGVEDADDARVDLALAVVGYRAGLGEALGLVVHGAEADVVDVASVILALGVDRGVAVAFGGGGHQEARVPG